MPNHMYHHNICFSFSQRVNLPSILPLSHLKQMTVQIIANLHSCPPSSPAWPDFSSQRTRLPHRHASPLSTARCCQLLTNSCSPRSLPPSDWQKQSQTVTEQTCTLFESEETMYISFSFWRAAETDIYLLSSCLLCIFKNIPLSLLFIFENS